MATVIDDIYKGRPVMMLFMLRCMGFRMLCLLGLDVKQLPLRACGEIESLSDQILRFPGRRVFLMDEEVI